MSHSYVQAHERRSERVPRLRAPLHRDTTLLVDTFDTLDRRAQGHRAGEDSATRSRCVPSGSTPATSARFACEARRLLDDAGPQQVRIFASSGLDEDSIAALVHRRAHRRLRCRHQHGRIGGRADRIVYKLAYEGVGRLKLLSGNPSCRDASRCSGSRKRRRLAGCHRALAKPSGRPLLAPVMVNGRRLDGGTVKLERPGSRAREQVSRLPASVTTLSVGSPLPRATSPALARYRTEVSQQVTGYPEEPA